MNDSIVCDSNCSVEDTNTTISYIPYSERPETYLVPLIFGFIFIVGLLGNGFLIYFFIKYPQLRNSPNSYIVSLAVGDLMIIFFCVPFLSTIYTTPSWIFGSVVCTLQEVVKDLSIGVSVFTITALSSERYLAIAKPMTRRLRRKYSTAISISFVWIAALVLSVPAAIFSHVRDFPIAGNETISVCTPFPTYMGEMYPKIVITLRALLYYLIPLIIIAVFYSLMAKHLYETARGLTGEVTCQQSQRIIQMQERRKIAKLVLVFVFLFAACFMPTHIFMLWFYYNPNSHAEFNHFWNIFRIIGFCFGFANSCINPIALYFISETYRKYFKRHLFCKDIESPVSQRRGHPSQYYSSALNPNTRSENIDMSTFRRHEKLNVRNIESGF